MKKRSIIILMTLTLIIALVPVCSYADQTSLDDPAVYYTPASDYKSGDCILTATKMMIRRASIMHGKAWSNISNESLRGQATIGGLMLWTFTIDVNGLAYKCGHGTFSGTTDAERVAEIEALLKVHPEGIVVHGSHTTKSGMHGVLAVSVQNGVIYAADSTMNTGALNKGIQPWSETTMINEPSRATSYWYIIDVSKGNSIENSLNGTETSTLRIKSLKAPKKIKKGKSFKIKGNVKSNRKIKNVTVQILDSEGNVLQSASKNPNAKSYNIKKLDSKIKFKKLKKGTYVFRVIATDKLQTLTLVDKQFKVK